MAKKIKRPWIDPQANNLEPVELDLNNLPVPKPVYTHSPDDIPPMRDRTFKPVKQSRIPGRVMVGTGQPLYDEEGVAAATQKTTNKYLRGIASRGLSVAPKTMQNFGHIAGAIEYGADYLLLKDADPSVIWDNAIANKMSTLDQGLREKLPIYKSYVGRNGNILQQMGDAGFWADDVFDSMAFLASAFAVGGITGSLGKSLAFSKAFMKTAEGSLQAKKFQTYTSTLFNTIGESGFEAKDFNDRERENRAYDKYGRTFKELTPENQKEISLEVAEGTKNVFRGNLATLLVPNYIQSRFMFGTAGKAAKAMRRGVMTGKLKPSDVNVFKTAAKDIATGIVSEGFWEEGMQNAYQTYNERIEDFGQNLDDYAVGIANEWVDNLETTEGQKNIILGGMMGAIFGGFGGVRQARQYQRSIVEEEIAYEKLKQKLSVNDGWISNYLKDIYKTRKVKKTVEEDGETKEVEYETRFDENGDLMFDIDKLQRMYLYSIYNKHLFDEGMAAALKGDDVHLNMVNSDALARLFYSYATNDEIVSVEEAAEQLIQRDLQLPDELVEEGYVKQYGKEDLDPIIKAYEEAEKELMSIKDFTEDDNQKAFKSVLKKTLFIEKVRRDTLEKLSNNENITDEQREQFDKLIEDSLQTEREIKDPKTREKLYKEFNQEVNTYQDALNKMSRINEEDAFKKHEDFLKAQYDIQEFQALNGKTNPFSTRFMYEYLEGNVTNPRGFGAAVKGNEFGTRYNHYYDIGRQGKRKTLINKGIAQAKKGKTLIGNITDIALGVFKDGGIVTEDEIKRIEETVNQRAESLRRLQGEKEKREQALKDNPKKIKIYDPLEKLVENPNLDRNAHMRDKAWLENYQLRKDDLAKAEKDLKNLKEVAEKTDRKIPENKRKQYRKFQRDFADIPVKRAMDFVKMFKSNTTNDEIDTLDNILRRLQNQKTVFSSGERRKLANTQAFKGYMESVDESIKELKQIRKSVEKNALQRRNQDRKSMSNYSKGLFSAIGIEIDKAGNTFKVVDQNLYDLIEGIVGKDFLESILNLAKRNRREGIDLSFDGIFVERIIHEVKKSKEGRNKILEYLNGNKENNIKGVIQESIDNFVSAFEDLQAVQKDELNNYLVGLASYRVNPYRSLDHLIRAISEKESAKVTEASPIDKFMRDKDVYELLEQAESGTDLKYTTISNEELSNLLKAHITVISNVALRDRVESTEDITNIVRRESLLARSKDKAPSSQQVISLRELMYDIKRPVKNKGKKYSLWFYVKGLAGTGKTVIMSSRLPELLGYKPENITALSTHRRALNVLRKSLKGVEHTKLANDISVEDLLREGNQMVIVDEIARLSQDEMDSLAQKLVDANKQIDIMNKGKSKEEKRDYIFFVVLGDPTQVISKDQVFAPINSLTGDIPAMKEINPLTSVFRTGNSSIISFQNLFQDFPGVIKNLTAVASDELGRVANGVHISKRQGDLLQQIDAQIKGNKDRSRVVVVSNPAQLKYYTDKLSDTNVEVMYYYDVAGLEFDEVYTDIDQKDFQLNKKFNEAMYTAASRAVQYVFARSYLNEGDWNYVVDDVPVENFEKRDKEIMSDYTQRLEFELEVLGDEVENIDFESPQEFDLTEKEESDIAEAQTNQEDSEREPDSKENTKTTGDKWGDEVEVKNGEVHKLAAPSNIKPKKREGAASVRAGNKVRYIKTKSETGEDQIKIISELTNDDGTSLSTPQWTEIGVMTNDELQLTKFGRYVYKQLEKVDKRHYARLSQGNEGALEGKVDEATLVEGTVKKAEPLNYQYNKEKITKSGVGFLDNLMRQAEKIFKNEKLSFSIKIFRTAENEDLAAGIPYLIIHRQGKDQYISLSGRYIKKDDKLPVIIRKYRDSFNILVSKGIEEEKVGQLLKRMKRNYYVLNGEIKEKEQKEYTLKENQAEKDEYGVQKLTKEQFDELNTQARTMIPLVYKAGEVRKEVKGEEGMLEYLGGREEKDKDVKYEFKKHKNSEYGYILMRSVKNTEDVSYVTEIGLEAGKGEAQIALNILAKSNAAKGNVENKHHKSWIIRTQNTEYANDKSADGYITTAKSLLTDETTYGEYYKHLLKLFDQVNAYAKKNKIDVSKIRGVDYKKSKRSIASEENVTALEQKLLEFKAAGVDIDGISAQAFADLREKHQSTPITLSDLNDILDFDESGSHNNMYYPLKLSFVNSRGEDIAANINDLEPVLATKLESINPTQIDVQIDPKYVPEVPYEPKEGKIKKEFKKVVKKVQGKKLTPEQEKLLKEAEARRNKNSRRMTGDKQELGRPLTYDQARKMLAKYVPESTTTDEAVLRFVDRIWLDRNAGNDSWGLYQNELVHVFSKDGKTFENPIRHEAFHKIFWEGLTETERMNVIRAFKEQFPEYNNKTYEQIEELIAEKWHRNETKPIKGLNKYLMDFFNWLSRTLGFMNRNTKNLDRFFATMESGYYQKTRSEIYGIKRPMKALLSMFNTKSYQVALDRYTGAKDIIQNRVFSYLKEGRPNPAVEGSPNFPMTRREVFSTVRREIESNYNTIRETIAAHESGEIELPESVYWTYKNDLNYFKEALKNYKAIWETIYENWEFNKAQDIVIDDTLTADDYMEELENMESENLSKHILDSDQWNQETTLSFLVKDFLSNILVSNNKYMKWREAYIRTLQLLDGLKTDDKLNLNKQIDKKIEQMGNHPRVKVVAEHIKTLYNRVNNFQNKDGVELLNTIMFTNEDVFVYGNNKISSDIHGPIKAKANGHEVLTRNKGEETRIFIQRAAKKSGIAEQEIIDHFFYLQDKDQFKGILNLLNNQQEKEFFIAESEWSSGGSYSVTYIPGSSYGIHTSILSEVQDRVRGIASSKAELKKFIDEWMKPLHKKLKTDKHQFVKQFLMKLGLNNEAQVLPMLGSEVLYNDIMGFFNRALKEYGEKKDIVHAQTGEVTDTIEKDMSYFVQYDKSTLSFLAKVISSSDQFIKATNIKTMDGKKRYLWSPSSFMSDTLNYIKDTFLGKNSIGTELPLHLQNPYYGFNPFIAKRNRIFRIVNNDGLRKIGYDEQENYSLYKNETKQDYILRSFGAGFLDRIRRGVRENKKYFQWFYPNERAQAVAAEVKLLDDQGIQHGIRSMVMQINHLAKEQGSEHANRDRFVNLRLVQEALKERKDSIWDKPLSEKEINTVTDKVYELLTREADKYAEELIKNRVDIDRDISRFTNLNSFLKQYKDFDITKLHNTTQKGKNILRSRDQDGNYLITKDMILPLVDLYVKNDYVNSYFLNQLVLTDMNQYGSEEDILRRYSLASAPGGHGVIHPRFGIRETARMLVMGDSNKTLDDIEKKLDSLLKTKDEKEKLPLLKAKFEKNFDSSDGQGFMLPERFEELKYGGFTADYSIHKVLKPVVFSPGADNVVRGVKFSSIVLTDELVKEFPSLGDLRDNMRKANYDEAVFVSGVKLGAPDQLASYPDVARPNFTIQDNMGITIRNRDYRIQLDPKSKIESQVTQPSQLLYLMNVLEQNQQISTQTYEKLAEIARIGGNGLMNQLKDRTQFREKITSMLSGKGSEMVYDALKSGLSIDFPIVTDKVITQIASSLNTRIAKVPFNGTKLVLQTEAGVRKYNNKIDDGPQNKLKYYRESEQEGGRLVAEVIVPKGLLPEEYESRIQDAIDQGKNADNYFENPDLLGFRIPSSDIHSGVAIKVVGFYSTPNVNVIIAPDLLVALHGSDFDVDSLFIIKRYLDKDQKPIGYKKVKGKYVYDPAYQAVDAEDRIKYLKNGILEDMLTVISSPKNVTEMLAPIPLKAIKEERNRIRKKTGQNQPLDLSNANDKLRAHDIIFGADAATGIFGNFGKVISYIMNAGKENSLPVLRDQDRAIVIGDRTYNKIERVDDTGEPLLTSNDGFINAAIDNIREMALHVLNINRNTIGSFLGMRAIGIPLQIVDNILQQPAILDLGNHHTKNILTAISDTKKLIYQKMNIKDLDISEVKVTTGNILTNLDKKYRSISEMPDAIDENGNILRKEFNALRYQLKILEIFEKGNDLGSSLTDLSKWLKIARAIPYKKFDIDDTIKNGESIFGEIQNDGQLPGFESKSFPFDIQNFFKNNVHILEILNQLKEFQSFISSTFKKYDKSFMGHVDRVYDMMDKKTGISNEGKKIIQDEILTYIMANEFYSGKYAINNKLRWQYVKDGEIKTLTGPKAFNQIFIQKIKAVRDYIATQTDENGNAIQNKFISHLNSFYSPSTKTWSLRFDGGSNLDAEDYLGFRAAFYDLNQYDVSYDQKTGDVKVEYHEEPRPTEEFTDFQNEFVSFGIMNWGLKFGATNYSVILPSEMYQEVDDAFNRIMNQYIGKSGTDMWKYVEDDFAIQFAVNYGDMMQEAYKTQGNAVPQGKYINQIGEERNFYGGKTDAYFYDRAYNNEDGKEMPRFILVKIGDTKQVFLRMNSANATEVHYQKISNLSPFPTYNFSDQVMNDGYLAEEHFGIDPVIGKPVYNRQTSDVTEKAFTYYGKDLQKGDIISFTEFHDVTRQNKVYKRVKTIDGNDVFVENVSDSDIRKMKVPKLTREEERKSNESGKFNEFIKVNYSLFNNTEELLDYIAAKTKNEAVKKTIAELGAVFVRQNLRIKFKSLPGADYGRYRYDGTIEIDIDKIIREKKLKTTEEIDHAIVHEMGHGILDIAYHTDAKFRNNVNEIIYQHFDKYTDGRLRPKTRQKSNILQSILDKNGYNVDVENLYGLSNEREFVTELLSNSAFAESMDQFMNKENKSLFRQFIDAALEFLGLKKTQTMQDYMLELLKGQGYTPNMIRIGRSTYRDDTGRTWYLDDSKLVSEEEVETEEKTKTQDFREEMKALAEKIKQKGDQIYVPLNEDGTEKDHYIDKKTADRIKRITDYYTGWISLFSNKKIDPNITFGQHMADTWWKGIDHDHKLETDEGNMENYDQFRERMDSQMKHGELKGKIMHLLFMKTANKKFNLGLDNNAINKAINDLESNSNGTVDAENYAWVEDPGVLEKIFHNADLSILDNDTPEILRDVVYLPEVKVFNTKLGYGGTIDALIGHADGTWTIIDWKTGRNFGKHISNEKLKYGEQEVYITDNQRERAKLQVMMYAFMLKLDHPDMKFRDLQVLWVPDRWLAERKDPESHVEIRSYLRMIEAFLSDKKALEEAGIDPNIKKKLLDIAPKIFDAREYTNKVSTSLEKKLIDEPISPEEKYRQNIAELTLLLNKYKQQRRINVDELDKKDKERISELYEEIQLMRADPSLQIDVFPGQEIGMFTAWLGNYSDVNMDAFQVWTKLRNERWNEYTMRHEEDRKKFESLLKPIYERYMKGKIRIRRGGIDRMALVNYPELFSFAYTTFEDGGRTKERLFTEDDPEWTDGTLKEDEKALLKYFNDMMEKWFSKDGYFTQKATEINGEDYSWLDLHNLDKSPERKMKYYRGWFPKVMKTQEEVNYEQGVKILGAQMGRGDIKGANILGRWSKESINERIKRTLTWYQEDVFEGYGDMKMAIPIKFLDNFKIVNNKDYSHSMMHMFDQFNKSSLHKQYMDSVYTAGEALKVYLQGKRYGNGQPMFDNVVGFLSRKLIQDVQNKTLKMGWSGKPIELGGKKIAIDKVIEMMQNWTSMTIMWLRPLQGGGNGLHAKMLTYRESFKGSIASKFLHIDGDAIDFKVEDNIFADGVYFGSFLKDSMIGDLRKNKMFLLAEKLNYMPDNYDYATNRRFLLSTRNHILNRSSMYAFHSKPEEYVSLTTMVAQLHYLKNPVDGRSLWDCYEVRTDENGITDVHWNGGVRGYERVGKGSLARDVEIRGLTTHEINKLKKVHERMQGGYRKEEAATLELYVLGRSAIQFKKYFPRLLFNAMSGKREEISLGAYKKLYEQKIDPETGKKLDVYEWTRRLNEGRWRTLANAFFNFTQIHKDRSYNWDQMTSEQKQNIVDSMLTIGMWGLSYGMYLLLFDADDDDDTFKKWWRNYLILNLSQQYNVYELLHTLETTMRPVSFARAWKLTEAIRNMLFATANLAMGNDDEALTTNGQLKGWNEMMRSIPYLASWHDWAIKMQHGSFTEDWWTDTWAYKWR